MKYLIVSIFVLFFLPSTVYAETNLLCDTVNHAPNDDVAYKPTLGVVPADLNAVSMGIGDIEIPLTAFLVQELDLNTPISSSKLGSVTIKENGSVIYDGKDISSNVVKLCAQPEKITEKIPEKPKKQDGQVKVEPVKSQKLKELKPLDPVEPKAEDKNLFGGFGQDYINGTYND